MTAPSWSITLPMPPALNSMYLNRSAAGMKGRMVSPQYVQWRSEADDALWMKKAQRFKGEVAVCFAFGPTKGRSDLDGRLKAPLDWLVRHQIIEEDHSKFVRMIVASWDDTIKGCKMTVSSLA